MNERDTVSNQGMPDWLREWVDHVPVGAALDVGAGEGRITRWLVQHGFAVDALEADPEQARVLRERAADERLKVVEAEVETADLSPGAYSLIVAAAVLHFIPPRSLAVVARKLMRALRPGGFLMAEVFTTDDPSYQWRIDQGVDPVAQNTYALQDGSGWVHFFAPGELKGLFNGLEILESEESRRRTVDHDEWAYRSGALLVARRPEEA